MASTPPPRSPVDCPPAPLWPAKYEHPREVRRSSRIAAGKNHSAEPSTPTKDSRATPPPTQRKDKRLSRNLFATNASSSASASSSSLQTPTKKKSAAPQTPSSIRQSAKAASRISKFSLDQRSDHEIMIFEDVSARIPRPVGDDEDDIFKASSSAKRRKTVVDSPTEPAEFQPPTADGMIVVQRGRKSFKKFEEPSPFTGPMPRKNLFGSYAKPTKAAPSLPAAPANDSNLATDDEETEREDSPEPVARNVRFVEAETQAAIPSTSTVMNTPRKASKAQNKTPRRTPKSSVQIDTSFLTPPATIQRDDVGSSFESTASLDRTSIKRKLSYSGPSTPEATPAKKRSKISAGIGTPHDDDVFESRPRRGKART
ncbi:hypothetical protein DRE_07314 [Drechslerella stenobrocha 248]|uniref:Uncharacterized protein n=1 Tax=Drechslerella stenobrocha 248 TaxID=1043628 RepID=W7I4Y2_9PEZI|nr:hypothetical protein DRE_07314 [Drechslerella stenobrocha 248]